MTKTVRNTICLLLVVCFTAYIGKYAYFYYAHHAPDELAEKYFSYQKSREWYLAYSLYQKELFTGERREKMRTEMNITQQLYTVSEYSCIDVACNDTTATAIMRLVYPNGDTKRAEVQFGKNNEDRWRIIDVVYGGTVV